MSLCFDMAPPAEASARSLSEILTTQDGLYSVQLESAAGGYDPTSRKLTGRVRVHNLSADTERTMWDVEARVESLTPSVVCGDFTFRVRVSWYRSKGTRDPPPGSSGLAPGVSCNDATWNNGDVAPGIPSQETPWVFVVPDYTPTGLTGATGFVRTDSKRLSECGGIALRADGGLYVSDTGNCQVVAFSESGEMGQIYPAPVGGTTKFDRQRGLCVAPESIPSEGHRGHLYIANTNAYSVVRWDPAYPKKWAKQSRNLGDPWDVTMSETGEVWVTDTITGRIWLSGPTLPDGKFFGSSGSGTKQFANPKGITVGPDELIYVSDTGNRRIVRLSYDQTTGETTWKDCWTPEGLLEPLGLCVDNTLFVYVADYGANEVLVLSPASRAVVKRLAFPQPRDVAVSPDGQYLYVAGGAATEGAAVRYHIEREGSG